MIQVNQSPTGVKVFRGASTEAKPGAERGIKPGSTFYEWDTASGYMFDGEEWLLQTGGGGGGGGTSFGLPAYLFLCGADGNGVPDTGNADGGYVTVSASESDFSAGKYIAVGFVTDPVNEGLSGVATGTYVAFEPFDSVRIPDSYDVGLYIWNVDTQTKTEVPNAITATTANGYYLGFVFAMPEVESTDFDYVCIIYENSNTPIS